MTKSKTTRRALFTSATAILLCVVMLVGTTFAWFTDTASTNVNKIQAGTLDIALYSDEACTKKIENNKDDPTAWLTWQKAKDGAGQEVLWEPGCTYDLETVYIKNEGNLALKYIIAITGIMGNEGLNKVIDWTIAVDGNDIDLASYAGELGVGKIHALKISGTMQTTAGNEYMGMDISDVAITVRATQDTVEYDSYNQTYDAGARTELLMTDNENGTYSDPEGQLYVKSAGVYVPVTTTNITGVYADANDTKYVTSEVESTNLKSTLKDGGNIAVVRNIAYSGAANYTRDMVMLITDTDLDLGNNTLTITSTYGKDGIFFDADYATGTAATISNGTIIQNETYGSSYAVVTASETTMTLNNMTIVAQSGGFAVRSAGFAGTKVILNDCTIQGGNTRGAGCIIVGSKGELEINSSKVVGLIYCSSNSIVTITGGDFTEATFYNGGTTKYTVTGGTFSEAVATATETTEKVTLASGYTWHDNGDGTYTVVPE